MWQCQGCVCVCVCVCVCRTSETEAQSDKAARLLGALRAGVEHLAEKVQPLKTVSKQASPPLTHAHLVSQHCV